MITTHSKANRSIPVFMDFLIFFHVPFSIKLVFPKKAQIKVSLMVTLIVRAFKKSRNKVLLVFFESSVIIHMKTNIFLFLLFIFLDFIFFSF